MNSHAASTPSTLDTTLVDVPPKGEFTEQLVTVGAGTDLVVIAPHGGIIERYTDDEAQLVFGQLSSDKKLAGKSVTQWACKGYRSPSGAWDRWHVTSTDISEYSFPKLGTILPKPAPFRFALAFHGFTPGASAEEGPVPPGVDIIVGGAATAARSDDLYRLQQHIINTLQDTPEDNRVVLGSGTLGGMAGRNIVNRLSDCAVQIEQSRPSREPESSTDFTGFGWQFIANSVARIFTYALLGTLGDPFI